MGTGNSAEKRDDAAVTAGPTRGCIVAGVTLALFVLIVLLGVLLVNHFMLHIRVAFADDQTMIFEAMREKAIQADLPEAVGCLEYALWYYPSGTKQVKGSLLDQVVERARQAAVREIIAYLRAKSGQDLGNDPQDWIKRFR
jgi:hypothetical protein